MGLGIYKAFTFDGVASSDYDIYLTGEGVFNAPKRAVNLLEIPGRNGNYALDQGRFQNITVTYKIGIFGEDESTYADKASAFRNWICSKIGYKRLEDEYNPNEYRMALYSNGVEFDTAQLIAGEATISFECKPQRWLLDGNIPVIIGEWGETETVSGDIVQFNADALDKVKSLVADIDPLQDLHGYDKPWVGGAGKNLFPPPTSSNTINGITVETTSDGEIWVHGTPISTSGYSSFNAGIVTQTVVGETVTCSINEKIDGFGIVSGSGNGNLNLTMSDTATKKTSTYASGGSGQALINVRNDIGNINKKFKIQLEVGSTQTSWTPYSNICPISGWSGVDVVDCGINFWDEEWELGALSGTGGDYPSSTEIRTKNYIPIHPSATYFLYCGTAGTFNYRFYDQNKTFISGSYIGRNNTLTAPSNAYYMRFYMGSAYGTTYNNDISINYPSTDHDYHAYNGTTISVQFKDENDNVLTVYGGRDEIIGGELTVTHAIVDMGDLAWSYYTSGTHPLFSTSSIADSIQGVNGVVPNIISSSYNAYASNSRSNLASVLPNGYFSIERTTTTYHVRNDAYTSESAFKTAMNGQKIVYELATPITYTLTPAQVDLLLGDNVLFASTGDVTVEYGQDPMVLINPTPFEAEPLLAVKGYGTIDFNGYEVEIENGELGTIQLANSNTMSTDTVTISLSNTSSLNPGDTIYFSHDLIDSSVGIRAANINGVIDSSTLTSSSNVVATPKLIRNSRYDFSVKLVADMSARFVYGTSSTITSTAVFSAECMDYTNITISASLTVVYDGDDTITVTRAVSVVGKTMIYLYPSMTIDEIYGDSTVNFLGDPTYIDCDLGECYKYESGEIVSLNGVIALGSDLPKLSSGANTFTMDGTVTELKVTPRWWKV